MAKEKGTLDLGIVEGKLLDKIVSFQASMMVLAKERGLTIPEMSVALDMMKDFLEGEGIHTGIIKQEKKK